MAVNTLGQGFEYPLTFRRGQFARAAGAASVEAALRMLFVTRKGQRFMLPQYGSQVPQLVFEPCDHQTCLRAEAYISEAIHEWIPRIRRFRIEAQPVPAEALIRVQIDYVLIDDPTPRTFIYPFYLKP